MGTPAEDTQINENLSSSYLPLLMGANRILDTLAQVWRYSVTILLLSLSVVGAVSIGLFVWLGREVLFSEGVIFLAIGAWIFYRNVAGSCNQCCTADIPHWKRVLASFVTPDNSVNSQQDGQSVMESLMHVVDETGDWIRLIRRDVFSMLFWPVIATVIFAFSLYSVDVAAARIVSVVFVIYAFVLAAAVYYVVKVKFQGWQQRASRFKAFSQSALDNL